MQGSIIKVFVSCPGDATPEKEIIKSVCVTINGVLSEENSSFRFEVLDFRDIVAPVRGRSQEEINQRFSDYDIYIGILWMRFGTPTGGVNLGTGKLFESGTEEEFRIAKQKYENGNRISMYLFCKSFRVPLGKFEIDQMGKIQDFKDEVEHLGWVNNFANNDPVKFTNQIHKILYTWLRSIENEKRQYEKKEFINEISSSKYPISITPGQFIKGVPNCRKIIPRTLSNFNLYSDPLLKFYINKPGEKLVDIINHNKYVVVLGSAGSGKSTELESAAHFFSTEDSPFIPVYHKLNTYVEQSLEDFLPSGWYEIPQNICLLILDGLDEIQPQHFNTALRQILNFVTKYPDIRIIISCRTNFYEFPNQKFNGTLSGFKTYFIDDISGNNIARYAYEDFGIDGNEFFQQAYYFGFNDLIRQPFFLNILLAKFKESGNLEVDKVSLLNEFIEQRIEFDKEHFKLTKNLNNKKIKIFKLLQKLALVMEYMGKNYLSYSDLSEVFPDETDIELIKFSTAFKSFETEPNKWGFEHNNIQEFLAARALDKLNLEEIKSFISFDGQRIKPSWVNTLFFLTSIIDNEKRDKLVNWILDIEPDILIKIEPDKVNKDSRLQIFKQIFAHYKKQDVWLHSNKFTTRELANFPPVLEANKMLLKEINSKRSSRIVKLNAVGLLQYQKIKGKELDKTKKVLLKFVLDSSIDPTICNVVSNAFVILNVVDKETIDILLATFGNRKNQYIRAGFYNMIAKANLANNYINYLIEGLKITRNDPDREKVHLMDEEFRLIEAFDVPLDFITISKILSFIKDSSENWIFTFKDKQDILRSIIKSAATLYTQHHELLNVVVHFYKQSAKLSEELITEIIYDFFNLTSTQLIVFRDILGSIELGVYEKSLLYKQLLTKEAVDYVLIEYLNHNLTNESLLGLYENVIWFGIGKKEDEVIYLTKQLKEKTNILADRKEIDYQQIRLENEYKNLSLYFSIPDFVVELKRFFENKQYAEVDWEVLWRDKRYDYSSGEIKDAIFDLLIDYTRGDRKVNIENILDFTKQTERFEDYLFFRLKDKLKNNSELKLSENQMESIYKWVIDRVQKTDIINAIKKSMNEPNNFSFSNMAMNLWYYISKFDLRINNEKILDFTTYSEPSYNNEIILDFNIIESQVGKESVIRKVMENLKNGVEYDQSWQNNAHYLIENNIKNAYPIILRDLADTQKSSYTRKKILKQYFDNTDDIDGLLSILKNISIDQLRWDIFEILTVELSATSQVNELLTIILKNEAEHIKERFKASGYLTKTGNIEGTNYYIRSLSKYNNELEIDNYYYGFYLRMIKNAIFINDLIALLVLANRPENKVDEFNRLDNSVLDALLNIATQSEVNMLRVKAELEKFISSNIGKIENINFYYPMIERMEFNFYLNQSRNATIKDAIIEVQKLK